MPELILKDEVYAIAGAAMEVYYTLGVGFLEPVHQEALAIELDRRKVPYVREERLKIYYKGIALEKIYRPDFVCYDQIIVELKSQFRLTPVEEGQIINYLKITNMHVGLLMNFGARPKLEWKRYVI
ncbi:MAG: GxxExxY protein [Acidobacteriota bacterium]